MSKKYVYVISDLHLGGAPNVNGVSFQMCPTESRHRLARFIQHIRKAHPKNSAQLVINGDFIDFLAEERIPSNIVSTTIATGPESYLTDAFTNSQHEAVSKLQRVIKQTDEGAKDDEKVFDALRAFVADGNRLSLLLGNHDLELSLPAVRHALLSSLGAGPAQIEFLYDGEALTFDGVLIEHGNRYDGFNAIAHGMLRAHRSALSRGEPPLEFLPPPGSRLVAEIMNPLKARYRFLDLLKPETEAAIPFLTALEPAALKNICAAAQLGFLAWRIRPSAGQAPEKETMVADTGDSDTSYLVTIDPQIMGDLASQDLVQKTQDLLEWAREQLIDEDVQADLSQVADVSSDWLDSIHGAWATLKRTGSLPDLKARLLRKGFEKFRKSIQSTFDLTTENADYLKAAERLNEHAQVIIFGHTHLPKRIPLSQSGLYLNTGTWCPTIRLPTDFYDPDEKEENVLPSIKQFIDDLAHNRTEKWIRLQTTFAKVEINGSTVTADLYEYKENGSIARMEQTS